MTKAEYYLKNRERILEQQAKYREAHRKEINTRKRTFQSKYNAAHRSDINKKKQSEYNPSHRAEIAWQNMHQRAENKDGNNHAYANVKVCARWSGPKGKECFVKDMGQPPKGTSLSRFGDIGNYKPSNCAWHTWKQQGIEKRKKHQKEQ